jgi:hypothetical protein
MATTGLTPRQGDEVQRLWESYLHNWRRQPGDRDFSFKKHLADYLSALALDAVIGPSGRIAQRCNSQRRRAMRAFRDHLGRRPAAADLLTPLGEAVTVPDYLPEVIRRDIERLAY